jgi:cytoskeletal protein CcmA (bactofilin family)
MTSNSETPPFGDALFDQLEEQLRVINARLSRLSGELNGIAQQQEAASQEAPRRDPPAEEPDGARRLGNADVDSNSAMNGYFVTSSDLRVSGVVSGNLLCNGTLFVTEEGVVNALVSASDVIVAGHLEGEVQCSGRFVILPTGSVSATVLTRTAVLESGAHFAGELIVTETLEASAFRPKRLPLSVQNSYLNGDGSHMLRNNGQPARSLETRDDGPHPQAAPEPASAAEIEALRSEITNSSGDAGPEYARPVELAGVSLSEHPGLTRNGKRTGRPRVSDRNGFEERFTTVLERLKRGELSHRGAARELSIGHATLLRLLRQKNIDVHS